MDVIFQFHSLILGNPNSLRNHEAILLNFGKLFFFFLSIDIENAKLFSCTDFLDFICSSKILQEMVELEILFQFMSCELKIGAFDETDETSFSRLHFKKTFANDVGSCSKIKSVDRHLIQYSMEYILFEMKFLCRLSNFLQRITMS